MRERLRMDLQWFAEEKTEPATPKKREDSRKKGQVARSMEVPSALLMVGAFTLLAVYGSYMGEHLKNMFSLRLVEGVSKEVTPFAVTTLFGELILESLLLLAPVFGVGVVLALGSGFLQYGFLFTVEPLKMHFEKLNPIEGIKQIFSLRALMEMVKSLIKIAVIAGVSFLLLWNERFTVMKLGRVPVESSFDFIAAVTMKLGLWIGGILLFVALLDYLYQRYEFEKSIRMSKQEIKDEYKKTEGDPLIKGKIREKQRKMAMQRMMQDVPKADVIITNPTHYAVAISYNETNMTSPLVVAKGVDWIALKIKQVAKEHHIVQMENKPLARALYAQVEIGQSIPPQLFQAVAEVLAYVYKVKRKSSR